MAIPGVARDYTLFQPEIFDFLENGRRLTDGTVVDAETFFRVALSKAANKISLTNFGFEMRVSQLRMLEAQAHWVTDVPKIAVQGDDPNHFKRAGFLAYWLRRRVFSNRVQVHSEKKLERRQRKFKSVAPEYCAFLIGLYLCAYFQFRKSLSDELNIERAIGEMAISMDYLFDVAAHMRTKNVSPHSLYLIYRSLFLDPGGPILEKPNVIAIK